jgi:hypothetical protein
MQGVWSNRRNTTTKVKQEEIFKDEPSELKKVAKKINTAMEKIKA